MTAPKTILYCKANSARARAQGRGVAYQEALARACADGRGYEIAQVVHDTGNSIRTLDPLAVTAMVDHIKAHSNDRFIVLLADGDSSLRDGAAIAGLQDTLFAFNAKLAIIGVHGNTASTDDLVTDVTVCLGHYTEITTAEREDA